MSRSHGRDPALNEHPLTEAVRLLAAEVRVLREAVDELTTEVQWQNQNRAVRDREKACLSCTPVLETTVMPEKDANPSPTSIDALPSVAVRRTDGRLFS